MVKSLYQQCFACRLVEFRPSRRLDREVARPNNIDWRAQLGPGCRSPPRYFPWLSISRKTGTSSLSGSSCSYVLALLQEVVYDAMVMSGQFQTGVRRRISRACPRSL
ncbi:hypothetical protein BD309DRAFT_564990 [Dichomitus squalens]|nr:hypothetical protein BD309DRAFT_564990 [Dichomitus squalens]